MIQEDRVFCVGCHHIIQTEKAGKVFRTGYYKCDMRLGLCSSCLNHESESEAESEAASISDSGETYMAVEPL